jgi:hypothetical protein
LVQNPTQARVDLDQREPFSAHLFYAHYPSGPPKRTTISSTPKDYRTAE